MKSIAMLLSFAVIQFCTAQNQSPQTTAAKIDELFQTAFREGNFNGCVLVIDDGKAIYKRSFGAANYETKEALNENSIFDLASVSKQFTAMAIMMLKERGKLNYDDPLVKYFPELQYKDITIRHLLQHTSGMPDYVDLMQAHWDPTKIATNKDIVEVMAERKPEILFQPGEQFVYSNTAYILLALIVEKTSGVEFGKFLDANIFRPLAMTNTRVLGRRSMLPGSVNNIAYGVVYDRQQRKFVLPDSIEAYRLVYFLDGTYGDGGIYSSVNDLQKWEGGLRSEKLVKQSTLKEAFTSGKLNNGSLINYGFAWFIGKDYAGEDVLNHTGGWPGYRNFSELYRNRNRSIFILRNNEVGYLGISQAIEKILNNEKYDKPKPSLAQKLAKVDSKYFWDTYQQMKNEAYANENELAAVAYLSWEAGQLDEATKIFEIITDAFPKSALALENLGDLYTEAKELDKAKLCYERVLLIDAQNASSKEKLDALIKSKGL